ncbi:MAG: PDZ domain-containing protein [Bacteroidia bacterium]|nr:PDZ domain-containing protein [Bacteroidia bacterium]
MSTRCQRFVLVLAAIFLVDLASAGIIEFHVAPNGNDHNPGNAEAPFATIERAQQAVRQRPNGEGAIVWLHEGVYHLKQTLQFSVDDCGTPDAPVIYSGVEGQRIEISGSQLLKLDWVSGKNGRWKAKIPKGMDFDQLFADGTKMIRARYPNFDPAEGFFGGLSRDATDTIRLSGYADPVGMFVHGYHGLGWGSLHFRILEKSPDGNYTFEAGKDSRVEGGWQNKGRALIPEAPFSPDQRFVENVIEELDAPKEWFLDRKSSSLYFIPPAGTDPRSMSFEVVTLKHLIEINGSQETPVRNLTFRGLLFRRAGYTFMQTTSVPSGGDWRIYRGGAIMFEGTEDCAIRSCVFDGIGGNGIFVKDYNRGLEITGCEFTRTGASAILFDGDNAAVRSRWAHSWGWTESEIGPRPIGNSKPGDHIFLTQLPAAMLDKAAGDSLIDLIPGPKGDNYPSGCLVQDCLIKDIGTVEKQISGVFISKSRKIVVSHVTIHDVPRAAININDGMWGGHIIEWCDIFNTCLESREHGSINTWGRDRYWVRMSGKASPDEFNRMRNLSRIDAVDVTTIRYNRVQCAAGYDIDLDDGSSHYNIYSNLCLQGGIKLREGFFRTVSNNVTPLVSMHVWYPDSRDVIMQNILTGKEAYSPRGMKLDACKDALLDFNLFALYKVPENFQQMGVDRHSLTADPQFVNPAVGDYRVKPGSPAETIGFVNFPMDRFGVTSPLLKSHAKTWSGLGQNLTVTTNEAVDPGLYQWLGATLRNLFNYGRESAIVSGMELSDNRGVLIKAVSPGSIAANVQIPGDAVIIAANDKSVTNIADLLAILSNAKTGTISLKILTNQGFLEIDVKTGQELPRPITEGATKQKGTEKIKDKKKQEKVNN